MSDDLRVNDEVVIPAAELDWRFGPSGGPGGQHANRAATRADLLFDVETTTAVDAAVRSRLIRRLGNRVQQGAVVVSVDESRSQWRNRQIARQRMKELLADALRPTRRRRPTKPTAAARRRRLEAKRHRSDVKRRRRPPDLE